MKKKTSIKIAWITAIGAIIVALIGIIPTIIKSFSSDNNQKKSNGGIVIQNVKSSSVITGNNSEIKNEK